MRTILFVFRQFDATGNQAVTAKMTYWLQL